MFESTERPGVEESTELTAARLRELLHYNPETGVFTRKTARPGVRAGSVAGSLNKVSGYVWITVCRNANLAHRLAWLYVHGVWPAGVLDHINRQRNDNRIANLRDCTMALNSLNVGSARSTNKSTGILGVYAYRAKYVAKIMIGGKTRHLGVFATKEEAAEA